MRNEKGQSVASIYSEASSSESTLESESEFDWDAIAKDVFRKDNRPVILFDGVCALCNGGVNFALDNDSKGTFLCDYFNLKILILNTDTSVSLDTDAASVFFRLNIDTDTSLF